MSLSNVLMNIRQNSKDVAGSCPNIITFYYNGINGVDIMDEKVAACWDSIVKVCIAFT